MEPIDEALRDSGNETSRVAARSDHDRPSSRETGDDNTSTVSTVPTLRTGPTITDKVEHEMQIASLPPMPVRRLHNYNYCQRLFYYQWVENLFVENADTVAGSALHNNVDKPSHWKDEIDLGDRARIRSLKLHSDELRLTGVVDLIEDTGEGPKIIDYKKGSARRDENGERQAKAADIVQIAAYALLLRVQNVVATRGSIYYAADRRRVPVDLTPELLARVPRQLRRARELAISGKCPPPLQDDPRCLYCSAYPICLPNESSKWAQDRDSGNHHKITAKIQPPRPPGDEGEIIVAQDPKVKVGKRSGEIALTMNRKVISKPPLNQVQSIYLYGPVQISTQAVQSCLENSIPIAYFSPAGRYLGATHGLPESGVDARRGQYRLYEDRKLRTRLAAEIIRGKIHNQRVLLMRNAKLDKAILKKLANLRKLASEGDSMETVRGYEGAAAALYFKHFSKMLKGDAAENFDFQSRNRRPPRDPVNALLSQGYSILAKEISGVCHSVGLDPFLGFFHEPKFGRPALALDLMEEFRPLIADSVAVSLLNRGELTLSDFTVTSRGTFLTANGRRQFWGAWFRRMDTQVTHPEFGYQISYRRMMEVQARQLWRFLRGEAESYHAFTTR